MPNTEMIAVQQADTLENEVMQALNTLTSGVTDPEQWLFDALGGHKSKSGVSVTSTTALGLPAVWSAVQRIAGHIGILPLELRSGTEQDSELVTNNQAYRVLNKKPNELQTPMVFRETMQLHTLLEGNGRAYIARDNIGRPTELLILWPDSTYTVMIDGEKWHCVYIDPDYESTPLPYGNPASPNDSRGTLYRIPDRDVLHIPGLSYNGLWGMRLLDYLKDIFGLDKAGQDTVSYSFANQGRPSLLIEVPKTMLRRQGEAEMFLQQFNVAHQGIDQAGRTGLLREGMKATTIPISSADSQHLENRKFSRDDIALIFGTELVMGEASSQYKNLTERTTAYIQHCLAKWFHKWEEECNRKMLPPSAVDNLFFRFNASALLKGDPNSTATYTSSLRTQDIITVNEARAMHNLNPMEETEETGAVDEDSQEQEGPSEDEALRNLIESYGIAVRAGAVTPIIDDEQQFRAMLGIPAVSEPVNRAWSEDEGFRRPITLAGAQDSMFGQSVGDDDSEGSEETENEGDSEAVDALNRMTQYEARRVRQWCKNPKTFMRNVEKFYQGHETKLRSVLDQLGLDEGMAEGHVRQSQADILNAFLNSKPDTLSGAIRKATQSWGRRWSQKNV